MSRTNGVPSRAGDDVRVKASDWLLQPERKDQLIALSSYRCRAKVTLDASLDTRTRPGVSLSCGALAAAAQLIGIGCSQLPTSASWSARARSSHAPAAPCADGPGYGSSAL